jgi:hypothetical protein
MNTGLITCIGLIGLLLISFGANKPNERKLFIFFGTSLLLLFAVLIGSNFYTVLQAVATFGAALAYVPKRYNLCKVLLMLIIFLIAGIVLFKIGELDSAQGILGYIALGFLSVGFALSLAPVYLIAAILIITFSGWGLLLGAMQGFELSKLIPDILFLILNLYFAWRSWLGTKCLLMAKK